MNSLTVEPRPRALRRRRQSEVRKSTARATSSGSPQRADGTKALITGGNSGIGLATARLFDSPYINGVGLMVDGGLAGAPFGAPLLRG